MTCVTLKDYKMVPITTGEFRIYRVRYRQHTTSPNGSSLKVEYWSIIHCALLRKAWMVSLFHHWRRLPSLSYWRPVQRWRQLLTVCIMKTVCSDKSKPLNVAVHAMTVKSRNHESPTHPLFLLSIAQYSPLLDPQRSPGFNGLGKRTGYWLTCILKSIVTFVVKAMRHLMPYDDANATVVEGPVVTKQFIQSVKPHVRDTLDKYHLSVV